MSIRSALVVGLTLALAGAEPARARKSKADPALVCVASKHEAAGEYCEESLEAWARYAKRRDVAARDAVIEKQAARLAAAWQKAEDRGAAAGIACGVPFLSAGEAREAVDSAVGAFVAAVGAGLRLESSAGARCLAKVAARAAGTCEALFEAEAAYQRGRGRSSAAARREKARGRIRQKFVEAFTETTGTSCPTRATADDAVAPLERLAGGIVRDTLAAPGAGDGSYVGVTPGPITYLGRTFTPVCMDGSPYRFFARRGTVNKLLVYYQGGGACWEQLTCSAPVCDANVTDEDDPNRVTTGFGDLANPANPFRDWHALFVAYCSCDVHFGDAAQDYDNLDPAHPTHVEHRGYHNARVAEQWARTHFLAPEVVFVAGSSAGAYGAWFNAPLLHPVWPSARFHVLADAGNGVVTQDFLETYFPNWNFAANLPADLPELKRVLDDGEGIPGYTVEIARRYPKTTWAHYTTAFDGGFDAQTGFYNLMLHGNNPLEALTWWDGSCAFQRVMRAQAVDTAARVAAAVEKRTGGNYRYYIGSGSRHTAWGENKVYDDTLGGVPTLAAWVTAMLAGDPQRWVHVEAVPSNVLLPGDPRPDPLQAPFRPSGADVVIDCPPAP